MINRNELFYELQENFYSALLIFEEQRDEYEHAVLTLAAREGVDRAHLRLPAGEVARLLDFKVLSHLRDRYLLPLRESTRRLYGGQSRDILDIMISDIFHLVSILKEEEFRVSHYAVLYDKMKRTVDRDYILESVHHDFPILLNQTHDLFMQAKDRLHAHLPPYAESAVVIRSIYLFGASYLDVVYADEGGLDGFYKHLYPQHGPVAAYLTVGRSFLEGGFVEEAKGAFEKARKRIDPNRRDAQARALIAQLDDLEARARKRP